MGERSCQQNRRSGLSVPYPSRLAFALIASFTYIWSDEVENNIGNEGAVELTKGQWKHLTYLNICTKNKK